MELISVIVPVYKTEAYLDRCVQSIVDQTYTNLEIILVDDGSPDNCPQMCDAWAEKDSRIKVIHKANGGGAQARNVGIEAASGEYFAFVDSDDYLVPSVYEVLYQILIQTDSDIAECGYYVTDSDYIQIDGGKGTTQLFSRREAMEKHILDQLFRQIIWNKLYKASTVGCIRFVEQKTIDDEFWTYLVLGRAERLAATDEKLYCYRQHINSVMHQKYSLKNLAAVEARKCRWEYLKKNMPDLAAEGAVNLMFTCMYHGQMALRYLSKAEQRIAFAFLEKGKNGILVPAVDLRRVRLTHRLWVYLAGWSLWSACRLRNLLRIGI